MQVGGLELRDIIAIASLLLNSVAIPIGAVVVNYVRNIATKADVSALKKHVDETCITKKEFAEFAENWPITHIEGLAGNNVNQRQKRTQGFSRKTHS